MSRSLKRRVLEFASYTVAGVAVVLGVIYYADHVPSEKAFPVRWVGFWLNNVVVFGYIIQWYRNLWLQTRYWMLLGGFVLLHFALYIPVLRTVQQWPLIWFACLDVLEWLAARYVFGKLELKTAN